jgi:hypothetical protein
MTGTIRHLWKHHPVALTLFALAAALVVVFALRIAVASVYWADPDHRHSQPEPWMTPKFVARSWDVPIDDVITALGLTTRPGKRMTLEQIAKARDIPPVALLTQLNAYLATAAPSQ